jgi:hypothetical protein
MKLMLMPKEPAWWIWLITASLLAAGLAGWPVGFAAAIVVSSAQTAFFAVQHRSLMVFSVQVRFAYTLFLLVCALPPLRFIFWVPALGTFALVLFGYCLTARMLSLMPWNRTRPFSLPLFWRTLVSPPVIGNIRHGLPLACPGGVCALERHAAGDCR